MEPQDSEPLKSTGVNRSSSVAVSATNGVDGSGHCDTSHAVPAADDEVDSGRPLRDSATAVAAAAPPAPAAASRRRGLVAATGWGLGFWLPLAVLLAVTVAMTVTTMVGVWVGISQVVITAMLAGGGLIIAGMCCLLCYQCYKRSVSEIMPKGQPSLTATNSEHDVPAASSASRYRQESSSRRASHATTGEHTTAESPLLRRGSSSAANEHGPQQHHHYNGTGVAAGPREHLSLSADTRLQH